MSAYLHIEGIRFTGPSKNVDLDFRTGVNVICGASDTGKSFLAEAIDFMLGGSTLKEIPERVPYSSISLTVGASDGTRWRFDRGISGGDFALTMLNVEPAATVKLRQSHAAERTDNVSGFLLEKIGLLGKRILKSVKNGTTVSLSFRNLARLVIVQEGEIQQAGSPFWGGQFTLKTAELATLKLLLTGVDDSSVISATDSAEADNSRQLSLLDELIAELNEQIADHGAGRKNFRTNSPSSKKRSKSGAANYRRCSGSSTRPLHVAGMFTWPVRLSMIGLSKSPNC